MEDLINHNAHIKDIALLKEVHPVTGGIGGIDQPVRDIDNNCKEDEIG